MKKWLKNNWLLVLFVGIIITIALTVIIFYVYNFGNNKLSNDTGDWGTFGDYIGGTLNPILAFFSFLALCYTINLQNKQLQITDEQLAQNKLALEQNAKALELNNQELKNSTEQLQLSAKAQLEMEKTQRIQRFEGLFTYMANELSRMQGNLNELSIQNILRRSGRKSYRYVEIRNTLGRDAKYSHFCIYLYQILKLIDDQDDNVISLQDKKRYSNIIRSSLDKSSLQLCFLNNTILGVYDSDFVKYKVLLEKYRFFEHMPFQYKDKNDNNLYDYFFLGLAGLYDFKAFGNNTYLTLASIRILGSILRTKSDYIWVEKDGKKNLSIEIKVEHPFIIEVIENLKNSVLAEFNLNSLIDIKSEYKTYATLITFTELKFIYKNQDYQLEAVFPNLFFEVNLVLTNLVSQETKTFIYAKIE